MKDIEQPDWPVSQAGRYVFSLTVVFVHAADNNLLEVKMCVDGLWLYFTLSLKVIVSSVVFHVSRQTAGVFFKQIIPVLQGESVVCYCCLGVDLITIFEIKNVYWTWLIKSKTRWYSGHCCCLTVGMSVVWDWCLKIIFIFFGSSLI